MGEHSERDLRRMEWQWHIDLALGSHQDEDQIAESARIAYRWIKSKYLDLNGRTLVLCVVEGAK